MAAMIDGKACSSICQHAYDVFLSFRGADSRKNFTDHLYTALKWAGIRTFRDDDEIKGGEHIGFKITKAIQESKMSLVVFSRDYASSKWCLEELLMIMKRRETIGHIVLPVFYEVDPDDVSMQTGFFAKAFASHEENFMDNGDMEEWREALRKVADLKGPVLRDRYEAQFIQDIVKEVGKKLNRMILHVPPYLVGIESRVKEISSWLQDGSDKVGIAILHGFGGVGKTTIAKTVFNQNFHEFDSWSFLRDVRETSNQPNGLVKLQRRLLSDILKGEPQKIYSVDEGNIKIQNALANKRVLIVLDDVDHSDQLDKVIGDRNQLYQGIKIIVTARHGCLLKSHEACEKFGVDALCYDESLQLFSWHAFGQALPNEGYEEFSQKIMHHCAGIPLVLEVLGSSLSGQSIDFWKRASQEPEAIDGDGKIQKILKISYDSLRDERDKNLFLDIACFFIGNDKDYVRRILECCGFYRTLGIQKLIDSCLITVDKDNKLMMHQLLRDMGREIVRQESPEDLGKRTRLWHHDDALDILEKNFGTETVKSLILDQQLLNTENEVHLEAEAFTKMRNLKLLHLNNVKLSGGYVNFPKSLVWLCWHGFSLNCLPNDLFLKDLVVLDLCNSSLKQVWNGIREFRRLKILDLSHSLCLVTTPDFSGLQSLEILLLEGCISLVEVHYSIGNLKRLVFINLKDCKNLRKLPNEMSELKSLQELNLSGCFNLEEIPEQVGKLSSEMALHAYGMSIKTLLAFVQSLWAWESSRKSLLSAPFTLSFLPDSLIKLAVSDCNLEDLDILHLSRLRSLEYLDLSGNPICNLPDSMNCLTVLKSLLLHRCPRLQSLPELPESLMRLIASNYGSSERITNLQNLLGPLEVDAFNHHKLIEGQGVFKLEPVRNFVVEMIKMVHLFNLASVGNIEVTRSNGVTSTQRKLSVQVLVNVSAFSFSVMSLFRVIIFYG
ncbi:disease resistance protein RPV1-like isoform X2 [Populus alba x Populus x berolinensis]|nr:disease resistance protein RPV1-like isoform X2 [Populus alba x Populus x berolinensis]